MKIGQYNSAQSSPFLVNPDKHFITERIYEPNLLHVPNMLANHQQMHCYDETVKSCSSYVTNSHYIEKESNIKSHRTIEESPNQYFETFNSEKPNPNGKRVKTSVTDKLTDIRFENIPRDTTDLRQESSWRHPS